MCLKSWRAESLVVVPHMEIDLTGPRGTQRRKKKCILSGGATFGLDPK